MSLVGRPPSVDDPRAGRHAVHGLDVERLFAVPALLVALRRRLHQTGSPDLFELALLEGGHAVVCGVAIDVVDDGRRGEGVDDGDRHTAAVVAVLDGVADTVGAAEAELGVYPRGAYGRYAP